MDEYDELYLTELQTQCRLALRALTYVQISYNDEESDTDEVWYHIQMFLVSIGNVSKMMKNNIEHKKINYKAHHQRIVLEYDLPKNYFTDEKNMRNHFEHYDENLLHWLEESGNFRALNNVGRIDGMISGIEFDYLKHFDPTTNILYFDKLTVNLREAYSQLEILDNHLDKIIEKHFRI